MNALRKELVRTSMRVRQKNKLFERLSTLGDLIFPQRKGLIKELSLSFSADIDAFVSKHFVDGHPKGTLYILREEIKALQGMAKVLTLNTQSFSHTRTKLSECWDQIREVEKERKKERIQKRDEFKQNQTEIQAKIDDFVKAYGEESVKDDEGHKALDAILVTMRSTELGRDEVKALKGQVSKARSLIRSHEQKEEDARKEKEREKLKLKTEQFKEFQGRVQSLIESAKEVDLEEIREQQETLKKDIKEASLLNNGDKKKLEKDLRLIKDILHERQELALMSLSTADKESLDKLRQLLGQRQNQKNEIRKRLEDYRKQKGSSGLDFEKALSFSEKLEEDKTLLSQVEDRIKELEAKIAELKP
ncbi:hypothetical protein SCG7109_AS_00010 [Chlamydiales bacterium SCGC AG-110-M15]|nr:hypothetical protein SCG7109_AS_00010 [Chlamydiales bacterium SCGC AG-110-M15]